MREIVAPILRALAARKRLILIVTALALVAAMVREAFVSPPYEAEVILVASSFAGGEQLSKVLPEAYSPKTYGNLAMSMTVLGNTLKRLSKDGVWEGNEPTLVEFSAMLRAEVTVVDETTRPVNYSPLITLWATGRSEALARRVVDTWAAETVRAARSANDLRIGAVARTLGGEEADYRGQLDTLWQKQAEEEAQWNLEVLTARLQEKVKQIQEVETDLVEAQTNLAATQQRVTSARDALGQKQRFLTAYRAPSDEVFWLEEANRSPEAVADLMKKGMVNMEPDPAYAELQKALDKDVTMAAGLEAQAKAIQEQLQRLNTERQELQKQYAEHANIQRQLTAQIDSMKVVYDEVAVLGHFTDAATRIAMGGDSAEASVGLSRLSDDTYCTEKSALLVGRKGRVVLIALLAFLLVSAYAVVRESGPALRDVYARRLSTAV